MYTKNTYTDGTPIGITQTGIFVSPDCLLRRRNPLVLGHLRYIQQPLIVKVRCAAISSRIVDFTTFVLVFGGRASASIVISRYRLCKLDAVYCRRKSTTVTLRMKIGVFRDNSGIVLSRWCFERFTWVESFSLLGNRKSNSILGSSVGAKIISFGSNILPEHFWDFERMSRRNLRRTESMDG